MFFLSRSFGTSEENVAWDDALIEVADRLAEASSQPWEALRIWQFPVPTVVTGRASQIGSEVRLQQCIQDHVPVLRRVSGGASIVAGPGCFMYTLLLSYVDKPGWRSIDVAHREVMMRVADATRIACKGNQQLADRIRVQGVCDLTIDDVKISGNALRCKRHTMMYHGTLLVNMPLEWLSRYLLLPPRQPEYRNQRDHESFVRNLFSGDETAQADSFNVQFAESLQQVWGASLSWDEFPHQSLLDREVASLLKSRYQNRDWNLGR